MYIKQYLNLFMVSLHLGTIMSELRMPIVMPQGLIDKTLCVTGLKS